MTLASLDWRKEMIAKISNGIFDVEKLITRTILSCEKFACATKIA